MISNASCYNYIDIIKSLGKRIKTIKKVKEHKKEYKRIKAFREYLIDLILLEGDAYFAEQIRKELGRYNGK